MHPVCWEAEYTRYLARNVPLIGLATAIARLLMLLIEA